MSITQSNELMTFKDLPFPRVTAWRHMRAGRLGYFKIGRRVYFSREKHLEPFLKSCERQVSAQAKRNKRSTNDD